MKNSMHVSIGLTQRGEHFVFQKRFKEPYKNYYGLLGGKIEEKEGPEQALVREIKEESGLSAQEVFYFGDIYEILHRDNNVMRVQLSVYTVLATGDVNPRLSEGEIVLIHPEKLKGAQNKFIPTDWIIINQLLDKKSENISNGIIHVYEEENRYKIINQL